jgi:hypothetical protein
MADTGGEGANKLRPDPRQTMGAGSSPARLDFPQKWADTGV